MFSSVYHASHRFDHSLKDRKGMTMVNVQHLQTSHDQRQSCSALEPLILYSPAMTTGACEQRSWRCTATSRAIVKLEYGRGSLKFSNRGRPLDDAILLTSVQREAYHVVPDSRCRRPSKFPTFRHFRAHDQHLPRTLINSHPFAPPSPLPLLSLTS